MRYEITGTPIPWAAHQGYGKRSYSIRHNDKKAAQWQLKIQHNQRPLIDREVRVDFFFEMPIPKSLPRKLQKRIADGEKVYHSKKPDRSNLEKHAADCLIGTILHDDNIIVAGETQKYYSLQPKTIVFVYELVKLDKDG